MSTFKYTIDTDIYLHIQNNYFWTTVGIILMTANTHYFSSFTSFYNNLYGNCFTFNSGWNRSKELDASFRPGPAYGEPVLLWLIILWLQWSMPGHTDGVGWGGCGLGGGVLVNLIQYTYPLFIDVLEPWDSYYSPIISRFYAITLNSQVCWRKYYINISLLTFLISKCRSIQWNI